jgi:hypothetical protein
MTSLSQGLLKICSTTFSDPQLIAGLVGQGRGDEGRRCSQEQLKELSGLLRVKHMGAGMFGGGGRCRLWTAME